MGSLKTSVAHRCIVTCCWSVSYYFCEKTAFQKKYSSWREM